MVALEQKRDGGSPIQAIFKQTFVPYPKHVATGLSEPPILVRSPLGVPRHIDNRRILCSFYYHTPSPTTTTHTKLFIVVKKHHVPQLYPVCIHKKWVYYSEGKTRAIQIQLDINNAMCSAIRDEPRVGCMQPYYLLSY